MRRTRWLAFLLIAGLVILQTSCAGTSAVAGDLMAKVEAAEWPASPNPPAEKFTAGVMDFSWNLLQKSAANPGNVLISPASVYLALAMTLNGADQETKTAMLHALSAKGLTLDDLNRSSRDWITLLQRDSQSARLSIANSIWYRQGFVADPGFLQHNADFFAAGAQALDFSKPEAVEIINGWVKEATKGTIEKILEQIGPAAVMYLINTVYFKADWKTQFQLNFTADAPFAAPGGPVQAPFMHRTGEMAYFENDKAQGILLPYIDEQYAFFAVLPATGAAPRAFIANGGGAGLAALLASARLNQVELALPRFEAKYDDSLVNELQDLGMGLAFSAGQADFSLMQSSRAKDLYISEVKHKTFFKINEVGSEAAAATLVEISKTGQPSSGVKLVFDRPFLYGILDQTSGLPLFIGIMENPG
jgi:serpin B